jgi:hypothetical protein
MYQVGFGDCFLLTIDYGDDGERHVLIDFGQKSGIRKSETVPRPVMGSKALAAVAANIRQRVGEQGLAGVVVTHRHEDHISGFGVPEALDHLTAVKPKYVLQSWTEDLNLPADASKPIGSSQRFLAGLAAAGEMSARLANDPFRRKSSVAGREIASLARFQLANQTAITGLHTWEVGDNFDFLSAPDHERPNVTTKLTAELPGVEVEILGPPRPEVWEQVRRQREDDPQYWEAMAHDLQAAIGLGAVEGEPPESMIDEQEVADISQLVDVGPARWLLDKLRRQQLHSVQRIVTWLDRSLNNTSVILLFRVGERRLLFGGDAQWENWSYGLTAHPHLDGIHDDLRRLDLYKVGHHGSRNATPKNALLPLWSKRRRQQNRVLALMSTLSDAYGEAGGHPVPAASLTTALRESFRLVSTEDYGAGILWRDFSAPADGSASFQQTGAG